MANVSNSVLALPYERRRPAIAALKPFLVTQGIDAGTIDQFDPSDDNIRALGHVDYTYGQERKDNIDQQTADTGTTNAQTNRLTAEKPVVAPGGSVFDRTTNQPVYTAPQVVTAPATSNVMEVGAATGSTRLSPDQAWAKMVGPTGRGGAEGGTKPDGSVRTSPKGAIGPAQVMPGTAPAAAKLAGLPYDENRYRTDPQYNLAIGRAYYNSLVAKYGGDTAKASAAYNAGPGRVDAAVAKAAASGNPGNWASYTPGETQGYLRNVHGGDNAMQQRPVRSIQQGVPAGTAKAQAANVQDQRAVDSTDQAIRSAQTLLNHPGLPSAVGSHFDPQSYGRINPLTGKPLAGTDAANFTARLDTLKAQTFLPQVQALRGLGALSDAEGKKLTDAVGALSTDMSETEFKSSLSQVIADLKFARDRAAKRLAQGGSTQTATGNIPAGAAQMLRQNPALRDAFEAKYGAGSAAQVLGQ